MTRYPSIPLAYTRPTPAEALRASAEFAARIATRRSVRHFATDPIPEALLTNAIAAAATAPSGANQQPWTFVVVTDPALKAQLREAAEAEERESYAHRMSPEWLEALAPIGTDWHKPHFTEAPALIVVFEQLYGLVREPDGRERVIKHYYSKESVGIAVGILLTSLHLAGLGTLTHTPSPMGFLAKLLRRPRNERAFVLIPVGYPAEGCQVPDIPRKALTEVLVPMIEAPPIKAD